MGIGTEKAQGSRDRKRKHDVFSQDSMHCLGPLSFMLTGMPVVQATSLLDVLLECRPHVFGLGHSVCVGKPWDAAPAVSLWLQVCRIAHCVSSVRTGMTCSDPGTSFLGVPS